MRYNKLPTIETTVKTTLNASGMKLKISDTTYPAAVGIRPVTPIKQHWIVPVGPLPKKKHVVYHATCGVLSGDLLTLLSSTVSVPYVIARDGTVYELYDPDHCSYHLGPSDTTGQHYSNTAQSFESVGIELSNIGPLKRNGNTLYDIYDQPYCSLDDTEAYDTLQYRHYEYFASYTEAQINSLARLTDFLLDRYSLPDTMVAHNNLCVSDARSHTISRHVNWRGGKSDMPNLNYQR